MTTKIAPAGREGVNWTDEEIEGWRQQKLEQVRKDEVKDKQEAWKQYNENHPTNGSGDENDPLMNLFYKKFEAEYDKDKTHLRNLEPADSYSQYYALGAIEMVMDMVEKLWDDRVIFNHPEYYREAYKAHTALFNLAQMVGLDWFDMPDRKKED